MSQPPAEAWSRKSPEASAWRMGDKSGLTMPPLRIQTDRLVLRCWDPSDAPLLKAAIDSSLDHLRGWMPWAMNEPSPLPVVEKRLARYQSEFLASESFVYGVFDPTESEVVGGSGLMARIGPGALEIGYWIRADRIGNGFATEATRALTAAGFGMPEVERIEIHLDPANAASAAIPPRLGYRLRETIRDEEAPAEGRPHETMIFEMTIADFAALGLEPPAGG